MEPGGEAFGWVPSAYLQLVDEDRVDTLSLIAEEHRVGAHHIMLGLAQDSAARNLSPDSDDSDALGESDTLGDKWTVAKTLRRRRSSHATHEPSLRTSFETSTPYASNPSLSEHPASPQFTQVVAQAPDIGSPLPSSSAGPTSFLPSRVRGFRLRSKSRDRGARSDSESTSRSRRPSISFRRNARMGSSGQTQGLEPPPAEEIARLEARPWYLQPRSTTKTGDILLDSDGSIRAGTLAAIAERLTCDPPSKSYEHAFRRALLVTYEAFTTSNQLFELLVDQYSPEPARQLTEEQFADWKKSKLRPTQARVLEVLGMWLDLPGLYRDDPEIVLRIRDFLQLVNEPDELAAKAKTQLRTVDKLVNPPPPTTQTVSARYRTSKPRPFPTLPSPGALATNSNSDPNSKHVNLIGPAEAILSANAKQDLLCPPPHLSPDEMRQGWRGKTGALRRKSLSHKDIPLASLRHSAPLLETPTSRNPTPPSRAFTPSVVTGIDPTALAHHLTLLEATLYMRVRRSQFLEWHRAGKLVAQQNEKARSIRASVGSEELEVKSFSTSNTTSTGSTETTLADLNDLREFCATNDRLAAWVKWSVLSLDTATLRAEAIGLWVRVAEKCRQVHNYSSLCAIIAGLTSSDITRLNLTLTQVPGKRTHCLTSLQRITNPAGGFAALKMLYARQDGPGIPFVGMCLTALVHASEQFRDTILGPVPDEGEKQRQNQDEVERHDLATPMQNISRRQYTLLNFTKRHKQADIINSALKFQVWPYTVIPTTEEPLPRRHALSLPLEIHLSPPASPSPAATTFPASTIDPTLALYPYTPGSSSPTVLYASAGGVAWVNEQLKRAARVTSGSDWTYERSMQLFEEETGWTGAREAMVGMGF